MNKNWFIFVWLLIVSPEAWAHDPGLSGTIGRLHDSRLELTISFALRDAGQLAPLDANNDGVVTPDEFAPGRQRLAEIVAGHCELKFDGFPVKPEIAGCRQDDARNVSILLDFPAPRAGLLELNFPIIELLPFGHRMFFSLSDAAGKTLIERLLSANAESVSVQFDASTVAPAETAAHTLGEFVLMGMEHIFTGYDHLLFLFSLLVVTRTFRSALAVITAFTIAHSITLAISTFNLVHISSNITEPLIAVTIIYVAVENLVRSGEPHKRWLLTFSFGLIHGFGFATALREMGVSERAGGVLMPLFGFNMGVELGQLTVAAIVLPIVWKLRTWDNFPRIGVPACSTAVALAGGFWFVQRVWFN